MVLPVVTLIPQTLPPRPPPDLSLEYTPEVKMRGYGLFGGARTVSVALACADAPWLSMTRAVTLRWPTRGKFTLTVQPVVLESVSEIGKIL